MSPVELRWPGCARGRPPATYGLRSGPGARPQADLRRSVAGRGARGCECVRRTMQHTGRYVAGIPFGIPRHVGGQQDVDRSAVPYSRQGPAREADAHGPGGDPQHVGGLCDGIPRRPGRSTVLSHEGDTKPLGLVAPGPALHKAIYRDEGALHLKSQLTQKPHF